MNSSGRRCDRLLDGTSDFEALRAHRLHLLAGRRWRELGEEIPTALAQDERLAAIVALLAPELLRRVVSLCDTSVVLHKGPEIAARYPDPVLRPCIDLDVLVEDAESTRRALWRPASSRSAIRCATHRVRTGFRSCGRASRCSSKCTATRTGRAGWAPADRELLDAAVPSALGVEGLKTLAPAAPRADRGSTRLDTRTDGSRGRSRGRSRSWRGTRSALSCCRSPAAGVSSDCCEPRSGRPMRSCSVDAGQVDEGLGAQRARRARADGPRDAHGEMARRLLGAGGPQRRPRVGQGGRKGPASHW